MAYNFFQIEKTGAVATLWLNRPEKRNFMSWDFWHELPLAVAEIDADDEVKAFIVAAKGASFSIGIDLPDFVERFAFLGESGGAEANEKLHQFILTLQKGMRAVADSPKPSLAAIHRHCIGGALDLISACDIRYAASDAIFSLREVKVAIVADMGSLQRLPYIIGEGLTRDLALTGRDFGAVPYGIEALMIMRTEKGFLHVGGDTDGTTLPGDVGMDRGMARKAANFVGRRSLLRPAATDPRRRPSATRRATSATSRAPSRRRAS